MRIKQPIFRTDTDTRWGGFSTAKEARKYLAMSLTDNGYMTKAKAQQGAASLRTNTAVQVQGWGLSINREEP